MTDKVIKENEDLVDKYVNTKRSIKTAREYRKNEEWLDEHLEELKEEYQGKAIIVLNQEVWGIVEGHPEVSDKLKELPYEKRIQACIRFFPEEGAVWFW